MISIQRNHKILGLTQLVQAIAYTQISAFLGVDSVLEQIEISNSQILKPLQNQQKSVLEQIEISEI
jgi:hypothetical protein